MTCNVTQPSINSRAFHTTCFLLSVLCFCPKQKICSVLFLILAHKQHKPSRLFRLETAWVLSSAHYQKSTKTVPTQTVFMERSQRTRTEIRLFSGHMGFKIMASFQCINIVLMMCCVFVWSDFSCFWFHHSVKALSRFHIVEQMCEFFSGVFVRQNDQV